MWLTLCKIEKIHIDDEKKICMKIKQFNGLIRELILDDTYKLMCDMLDVYDGKLCTKQIVDWKTICKNAPYMCFMDIKNDNDVSIYSIALP